jgi:hypothetical protein
MSQIQINRTMMHVFPISAVDWMPCEDCVAPLNCLVRMPLLENRAASSV